MSWYAGLRFYGVVPPQADVTTVEDALATSNIETFVLFGRGPVPGYLRHFRAVAVLPTLGARVLRKEAG